MLSSLGLWPRRRGALALLLRQRPEVLVDQRPVLHRRIVAPGQVELIAGRVGPLAQIEFEFLHAVQCGSRQLVESGWYPIGRCTGHLPKSTQHLIDGLQVLGTTTGLLQLPAQLLRVGRQLSGLIPELAIEVAAAHARPRVAAHHLVVREVAAESAQTLSPATTGAAATALLASLPPLTLLPLALLPLTLLTLTLLALALLTLTLLPLALLTLLPLTLLTLALLTLALLTLALLALTLLTLALLAFTLLALALLLGPLAHLFLQGIHAARQIGRLLCRTVQASTAFGLARCFERLSHTLAQGIEVLSDTVLHRR